MELNQIIKISISVILIIAMTIFHNWFFGEADDSQGFIHSHRKTTRTRKDFY